MLHGLPTPENHTLQYIHHRSNQNYTKLYLTHYYTPHNTTLHTTYHTTHKLVPSLREEARPAQPKTDLIALEVQVHPVVVLGVVV